MDKKKLQLEELKVKSFVTVIGSEDQKTTKGGYVDYQMGSPGFSNEWTTIKTRRRPFGGFLFAQKDDKLMQP
ncbi:MAG: pinensin family lanthipeptide [Saprospiraceae bacterium]